MNVCTVCVYMYVWCVYVCMSVRCMYVYICMCVCIYVLTIDSLMFVVVTHCFNGMVSFHYR